MRDFKKIFFYFKLKLIIFIFLLLNSLSLYAEKSNNEKLNDSQAINNKQIKAVNYSNNKKNNWPAEFIPSEKIKADTSVSFPVDI